MWLILGFHQWTHLCAVFNWRVMAASTTHKHYKDTGQFSEKNNTIDSAAYWPIKENQPKETGQKDLSKYTQSKIVWPTEKKQNHFIISFETQPKQNRDTGYTNQEIDFTLNLLFNKISAEMSCINALYLPTLSRMHLNCQYEGVLLCYLTGKTKYTPACDTNTIRAASHCYYSGLHL